MPRIVAERWLPCPEGELDRLEVTLRTGRFRQIVTTVVLAVVTALAVMGAAYQVAGAFWPQPKVTTMHNNGVPCAPGNP